MDKYIGKRLDGRYEIHELIGVGGMAVVYRAYDIIDDRTVAIKILKDEFIGNDEFIRRFKNESKAIAVLSHDNIVKVYDVSFGDKIQYIVMEYIDGITLKEYLTHQKEIKWKEAIHFTTQILAALDHAHKKGIIHRDVKPQNIILLQDGTIKVTDFGIARFSRSETRTMTDKAIGSVHYIAPEQARGDVTDEKADIYSVGVMLYEMLTGELPFEADNAVSVAIMQLQTQPRLPRDINPEIPEGLEEITMKAMQKDPQNRYQSAADMLNDIERFKNNPSIKFEYKYLTSDSSNQYMQAINDIKSTKPDQNYGDNYDYDLQEKKKKTRTTMIISGIVIALVLFAIVFFIVAMTKSCGSSNKDVDVPNFIGMKLSDVQNNPDYNFKFEIKSAYDANQPEGVILDQEPKSSTKKVKEGSTIILHVNSSGAIVSVPTVKGLTEDAAKAKIVEAGLVCEILNIEDSETAKGIVKSSDPQGGTKVTVNSTVKVYVSKGPADKKVTVPNVIDKSLSNAKNELVSKGLKVSDNIVTEDSDKPKDTVIATDPLPGVEVAEGYAVQLTVSSGSRKEKTIEIYVKLPSKVNYEVTINVYVDGVRDSTKKVVPAYNSTYTVYVSGSSGTKTVNIDINGNPYRVYAVNFDSDNNPVKVISEYDFVDNSQSDPSSAS